MFRISTEIPFGVLFNKVLARSIFSTLSHFLLHQRPIAFHSANSCHLPPNLSFFFFKNFIVSNFQVKVVSPSSSKVKGHDHRMHTLNHFHLDQSVPLRMQEVHLSPASCTHTSSGHRPVQAGPREFKREGWKLGDFLPSSFHYKAIPFFLPVLLRKEIQFHFRMPWDFWFICHLKD